MRRRANILPRVLSFGVAACAAFLAHLPAAAELPTGAEPFRVRIEVMIDARHGVRQYLERAIARELPRQMQAALGPPGEVQLAAVRSFALVDTSPGIGIQPASPAAEQALAYDKVLHLEIRATYTSFRILAQDYDVTSRYLCPPFQSEVRQPAHVVDAAVEALLAAFSPLAEFQQIPDDPERVLIQERLSTTSPGGAQSPRLGSGDVLIPVLSRDAPDGESSLHQTQVVPWTVLLVEESDEGELAGRVIGSSRHPLGVRRRGRIEQLAVAVRPAPAPVTLRLVTQVEPHQPLPGCSVFLRVDGVGASEAATPISVTDQAGRIEIPPGEAPVQVVWIKSGSLLLGKLPIVFGLYDSIEVPLAEDPARVRAEADLAAVRTELVDLVARRNILLARSRAALKARDLPLARRLADELDRLPTRSQFNQRIDSVAQTARSQDRLAQTRIDTLLEETRSVLGQYLDPREIGELRNVIIQAANEPGG